MGNLTGTEVIELMNERITEMEENGITAITVEAFDEMVDDITTIDDEDSDEDELCETCELSEKLDEVSEKLTELLKKLK